MSEVQKKTRPRYPEKSFDAICKEARKLASLGLTIEQICHNLGMSTYTFYNLMKEKNELNQSLREGRADGMRVVTNALFDKCRKGDTQAIMFYLKTRSPQSWQDKQVVDHNITLQSLTDSEIETILIEAQEGKILLE